MTVVEYSQIISLFIGAISGGAFALGVQLCGGGDDRSARRIQRIDFDF